MSQNFRLFHVSNLFVRNFRISLLMYTGSVRPAAAQSARAGTDAGRDTGSLVYGPGWDRGLSGPQTTAAETVLVYGPGRDRVQWRP